MAKKDVATNTLTVAEGSDSPELFKKEIELSEINFINHGAWSMKHEAEGLRVLARVRYRQPLAFATLSKTGSGSWKLVFMEPQKFVAPGQSAVFYSEDGEMLGGGVII